MESDLDLENMARGFIHECLGNDLLQWGGEEKDEKYGTYYGFRVEMLAGGRLNTLKDRFEILEVLPADDRGFKVYVQRLQ